MSWIIIKQPHALDRVWEQAIEAMSDADSAMDALGDDFTSAELDAAGNVRTAAIQVIMALPARHIADTMFKLSCAAVDEKTKAIRHDCDADAILREAVGLLDAAITRGAKLHDGLPDLLEGVSL